MIKLNLSKLTFNDCKMTDVKLTKTDLTGSVFNGGSLTRVLIEGAILKDVQFSETTTLSSIRLYDGDPGMVHYFPKNKDKNQDLIVAFIGLQKDLRKKANCQKAADSIDQLIPYMKFDLQKEPKLQDLKVSNGPRFPDCDLFPSALFYMFYGIDKKNLPDYSHDEDAKAIIKPLLIADGQHVD